MQETTTLTQAEREQQYQRWMDEGEAATDKIYTLIEQIPDYALQDALMTAMIADNDIQVALAARFDADPEFVEFARAYTVLKHGTPDQTTGGTQH